MNAPADFTWMRTVLQALFDDVPAERAIEAIKSGEALDQLRAELGERLASAGTPVDIPEGEYGNNLMMALLALRVKFSRDEAFAKLNLNISMRERRGGGVAAP